MQLAIARTNLLTANDRLHHHAAAKRTALLRQTAHDTALAQNVGTFDRAHVTVTVTWPDRRRRDVLNLAPSIKALIDGMTDAGCWSDDDDTHLIGPDFRVAAGVSGMRGVTGLLFTVTEARPGGA